MIDRLVAFCLDKRLVLLLIAIFVCAYGCFAWTQMKFDAYPDLGPVSVQVTTQVPGLAAEEVEQQITIPLERALNGTPGLETMRSSSTLGLSLITMLFHGGTEDYWERQRVTERITSVTLPPGAQPGLSPVTGANGEIFRYTLESDTKNLMELSEIQRWIVIPALQQVSGVANVDNFGGFTRQFQLQLDPTQLLRYGVGLNDVVTAITNNSANAAGSRLARGEQSFVIRGVGLVHTLDDLGNIVVTQRRGVPILVHDLGELTYDHREREGILGKNGNPDTIEGIVDLLRGANASQVMADIHAKVEELRKEIEPQDVHIVPYIDRSDLIRATVSKVAHTLFEGIGLVTIVLVLFLGGARGAMVIAVTIPLAMVAVFILMNLTNMTASMLSMGAIDFGVIVDGAIVVTENILRRREAKPKELLSEEDVQSATKQVVKPILFATLIIIAAYLPLFALQRGEAILLSPMAYTMSYALFGALLSTITLVPGLAYMAFRQPRPIFHNRPLEWLQSAYRTALTTLLRLPAIAVLMAAGAVLTAVLLAPTVGREFLPELDEGALWLQVQLPSGLSMQKASEMASELRRTLREFPEVAYVITQLGRNDTGTDPWTPSHIEVPVGLTPYSTWPEGETKEDLLHRMNARLQQLPGFETGISQPISDMVDDLIGGSHSPLVIRVFGEDFSEMRRIGKEIVAVLRNIRGTADASVFQELPLPQIVVEADRAAAARYGINMSDITNLVQTGIGGAAVSQVFVGDRVYDVTVRFPEATRNNPETLGNLVLSTSAGAQIPLSEVANIKLQSGESTITREMNHRNLSVRIDLAGRDLVSYLAEAQREIDRSVHFDTGKNHLEYGGWFESQQRAQARFALILALVLGVMTVLLYAAFGKLRQAFLILGTVPLATLGGLIALHVTDTRLNIASAVGFIALFGVAVQNGIIMVANLNRVREFGIPLRDAIVVGAAERFRPVLMTATVATVGMLPAALATGVGSDVQRGLATVVVGGLLLATVLTLFILPAFYYLLERWAEGWSASAGATRPLQDHRVRNTRADIG